MAKVTRIRELSESIAKHTAVIDDYFIQHNLPTPSFDADALWELPIPDDATEIKAARNAVIHACLELEQLLTAPKKLLNFPVSACRMTCVC